MNSFSIPSTCNVHVIEKVLDTKEYSEYIRLGTIYAGATVSPTDDIYELCRSIKNRYDQEFPDNRWERLFNCSWERDDLRAIPQVGLVLIYSWGHGRSVKIMGQEVVTPHNSILCMLGEWVRMVDLPLNSNSFIIRYYD